MKSNHQMVISQYNDSFVISGVKIIVALIHKLRNIFLSLVIGRGTQDASKTNPLSGSTCFVT